MKRLVWLNTHYQPVTYMLCMMHENISPYWIHKAYTFTHGINRHLYIANMGIYKSPDSFYIVMWNACMHECISTSIS